MASVSIKGDNGVASDVLNDLTKRRETPSKVFVPSRPGVYAVFAAEGCRLPVIDIPSSRLLYIGETTDLSSRNHFHATHSGFYSLRRSLGALLKEPLDLSAQPRSTGRSRSNIDCYRFNPEGELRLTRWMLDNLDFAIYEYAGNVKALETALIKIACPVLNLNKWKNPHRATLQKLRKICKDEAKLRWLV